MTPGFLIPQTITDSSRGQLNQIVFIENKKIPNIASTTKIYFNEAKVK